MGILWFILRLEALFLGWLARALKRVCCKILSRPIVLGYGANKGHGMKRKSGKRKSGKRKSGKRKSGKRKSGKRKSGKRKSGKRSFKPLEISFSWFKVVLLMKR